VSGRHPLLSIVIPLLNEAENLPALHARLTTLAGRLDRDVEYVFVDDGSTDESFARLCALRERDPRIRVLRLSRNFGSHGACLAGFTYARGEHAVVLSADLQDPPEVIADMLAAADRGHDVVLGSRETRDDPARVVFFSSLYNRLMRRIAMPSWPEKGFDFLLASRRVLDILLARSERNSSVFGQILWSGFSQAQVPYRRGERRAGRSKWTLSKKIKLALDSFVSFSYVPIRLISALGLAFATVGMLYAVFVVAVRLTYGKVITGWASLMVVLLIIGGMQIIMLGVIGEYLWRALDEARGRPPFIVADTVGFDENARYTSAATEPDRARRVPGGG
jgi:glycosyltransferase involved in cell wall biosynthesis